MLDVKKISKRNRFRENAKKIYFWELVRKRHSFWPKLEMEFKKVLTAKFQKKVMKKFRENVFSIKENEWINEQTDEQGLN